MQHQMTDHVKSETSHYVASTFEIFVMKFQEDKKGYTFISVLGSVSNTWQEGREAGGLYITGRIWPAKFRQTSTKSL